MASLRPENAPKGALFGLPLLSSDERRFSWFGLLFAPLFVLVSSSRVIVAAFSSFRHALPPRFVDFPTFYAASVLTFRLHASPYRYELVEGYFGSAISDTVWPYLYPPTALLFLAPLALLDYSDAALVTLLLNILLSLTIVLTCLRIFDVKEPICLLLCAMLAIGFIPFRAVVTQGQVDLAVTLAILWAWRWLRGGDRPVASGILIGVACAIKVYPVLFLFPLAVGRHFQALFAALAAIGILVLASWLILPDALWHDWLVTVVPPGGYGQTLYGVIPASEPANYGFNGVIARAFGTGPAARIACLGLCVGIAGLAALTIWRGRASATLPPKVWTDLSFALVAATLFLIAPLSWVQHLVLLFPGLIACLGLTWPRSPERSAADTAQFFGILVSAMLIAINWAGTGLDEKSLPIIGPLLFYVCVLWIMATRKCRAMGAAAAFASP